MGQATDEDYIRERLDTLAERRRSDIASREQLHEDIRVTVREAQVIGISMTEIARLLDMDRSSVYRTYVSETPA
jgi:hypothetical protein